MMGVYRIFEADSLAGAGVTRCAVRFEGLWFIHSVSLQNEDSGVFEAGVVKLQFNKDQYTAAAPWHPVVDGDVMAGASLSEKVEGVFSGTWLVVGEVTHAAAVSHRLTVLAYKMGDR